MPGGVEVEGVWSPVLAWRRLPHSSDQALIIVTRGPGFCLKCVRVEQGARVRNRQPTLNKAYSGPVPDRWAELGGGGRWEGCQGRTRWGSRRCNV